MKKIEVCVDARMINNSGIGVYLANYLQALVKDDDIFIYMIGEEALLRKRYADNNNVRFLNANIPIYSVKEQLLLPTIIPPCDIFWSPHYNVPLLPIRAQKRLVTIHDVYHIAHSSTLNVLQKLYAELVTRMAAFLSEKVLTVSNFSKNEIIKYTNISSSKIRVIPSGIDNQYFKPTLDKTIKEHATDKYNLPHEYLLYVGNIKPNKNLTALLNGFEKVHENFPELKLVIAGKKEGFLNGDTNFFDTINQNQSFSKKIVFTGYIDVEDLPTIYSLATVFVFPSLYEGFGFPPLEAMACGTPVIASNKTSIPEVCGEAALYVDPTKSDEIANAIQATMDDKQLRSNLIILGEKKVLHYDWNKFQQIFIEELKSMVSSR